MPSSSEAQSAVPTTTFRVCVWADHRYGTKLPTCVVLDIEGTVAPISFVADVMFPYAKWVRLAAGDPSSASLVLSESHVRVTCPTVTRSRHWQAHVLLPAVVPAHWQALALLSLTRSHQRAWGGRLSAGPTCART